MPHSIDFHASQVDPAQAMRPVPPGGELTYQFRAEHAGIWLYHCGTPPRIQHVAMGMYGVVVIDPPTPAPAAVSEAFVQSEFYLGAGGGISTMAQLLVADPNLVAFNGYADQYKYAPIHVRAGQRIRLRHLHVHHPPPGRRRARRHGHHHRRPLIVGRSRADAPDRSGRLGSGLRHICPCYA